MHANSSTRAYERMKRRGYIERLASGGWKVVYGNMLYTTADTKSEALEKLRKLERERDGAG